MEETKEIIIPSIVQQDIKVVTTEAIAFVKAIQEIVQRGGQYKEKTPVYLSSPPLMAEFVVDIPILEPEKAWKDDGPIIRAVPLDKSKFIYPKEVLEEMDWELLKKTAKWHGLSGRDRTVLITQYLKATGQEK